MNKTLLSIFLFPLIDYIYLSNVSSHFSNVVKKISKEDMVFSFDKAILAYVFLIYGLHHFILKDLTKENLNNKLKDAFILGLVIYGTYDMTTGAIFKDYDYKTAIMDTIWGGVLYFLITYLIGRIYF